MAETRIIKEVDYFEFRELIDRFKGRLKVNLHAYFTFYITDKIPKI